MATTPPATLYHFSSETPLYDVTKFFRAFEVTTLRFRLFPAAFETELSAGELFFVNANSVLAVWPKDIKLIASIGNVTPRLVEITFFMIVNFRMSDCCLRLINQKYLATRHEASAAEYATEIMGN